MVTARRKMHVEEDGTEVSLGQVGEPGAVRTELLESLLDGGIVPVIAPIAIGSDGMSYNVNADTMSGAIAAALGARALLLLTDVAGVLDADPADGGKLLPTLSLDDVTRLKTEGVITGGMIPKLETACDAVSCCVDTYVPGPQYCACGLRVPASCVPYVPKAQGSLSRGATHCTYGIRVPASGVPYVPRTVAPQVSGGVGSAVIMDGRVQHCTLQHFFGEGGVGTAVVENN